MLWLNAFLVLAPRTVTFDVIQGGKTIGKAIYSMEVSKAGKLVDLALELPNGNSKVLYRSREKLDAAGVQTLLEISQTVETIGKKGSRVQRVTFAPNGDAMIESGGKTRREPFKRIGRRGDLSEFWFALSKPSPATWVNFRRFNGERLDWETCRTTYVGVRPITVSGRSVKAHLVTQKAQGTDVREQSMWVDDQGLPVRITSGSVRFDRRW